MEDPPMTTDSIAGPILAHLGIVDVRSVTPVTGGADGLLWKVETGDDAFALRVLGPDQAKQAEREVLLNQWMSNHGIPAPAVFASGAWRDRPAYLMRWIDGQPLSAASMDSSLDEEGLRNLLFEFGATQARIHATPPPPGLDRAELFVFRFGEGDDLQARLADLTGAEDALVHLDYHPLNVMVNGRGIAAVLDWANARVGDRRFDLARTQAIIELAPIGDEAFQALLTQAITLWNEGYTSVAGPVEIPPLFRWWAAAFIEQEHRPRLGNPALPWLTEAYLDRVHAYVEEARLHALETD
jgi:aminoglycoside phosphotransferase (APT) family kinase protein